jgi:hypothetical protein
MNVIATNNIDHQLVQQVTCKLKTIKCDKNVIKSKSNCNVWGWKNIRFLLVNQLMLFNAM